MTNPILSFRPSADHDWTSLSFCSQPGAPDMFPHPSDTEGIRQAINACGVCPVRYQCLTTAFERGENEGIWGGMKPEDRINLRRRVVRSARSSKTPVPGASAMAQAVILAEVLTQAQPGEALSNVAEQLDETLGNAA